MAASTTLMALKAQNEARLSEEKAQLERRRNLLVLILRYCQEQGYVEAVERLQHEGGTTLSKFEVADNVDLFYILQEFEAFYEMKFGRRPKLVRRVGGGAQAASEDSAATAAAVGRRAKAMAQRKAMQAYGNAAQAKAGLGAPTAMLNRPGASAAFGSGADVGRMPEPPAADAGAAEAKGELPITGSAIRRGPSSASSSAPQDEDGENHLESKLLRPLPAFGNDSELRALAATITRDIYQEDPDVHWGDIVQLDSAKRLLKEAVVMPIKYPQLFTGLLAPWCGVLLYGPPGTGKTMLAKAVATECHTTFFNISASSIVSKFRGDSEKLVRMLFELARYHAPSTIFLDEIDSIMSQRGGDSGSGAEHESSRRMKTELLIQMDGLAKSNELVFLLAASNLPWELDAALLRRLEKRVLVALPGEEARHRMLQNHLSERVAAPEALAEVAARTDGFSGADIKLLAKEAAMIPVRRLMSRLESLEEAAAADADGDGAAVAPEDVQAELAADPITEGDLQSALERTRPSAQQFAERYTEWERQFGSV